LPLEPEVRIVLGLCVAFIVGGYLLGLRLPIPGSVLTWLWLLSLPVALIILQGGVNLFGFEWSFAPLVDTTRYGGLMLTLLLAVVGIAFSFPIGVLLALGRRSELPAIKYFSISYIELIRGVPLITLLFMGSNMLPLFLPQNAETPSAVVRAVVVITLFSAAYLAENVRGGLQAIPHGQYEAADALGLNGLDKLRHIILPQALTKVIPAIVGQFIGLYKDTSLVILVGLLELMGVAKSVTQQPEWLKISGGVTKEVFLFVALVYFIFSFGMSYSSRRLEANLGAGRR
jgi:general L-amino acid transport system permease protein